MEQRMLLWLYVISAGFTAIQVLKRRGVFRPRFFGVLIAIGVVAAAGLAYPPAARPAFWLSSAGFVVFLVSPGLLVRLGRRAAAAGRFRRASRILEAAHLLLPATGLRSEGELYRRVHESGGAMHPAAAEIRARLEATNAGPTFRIAPASTVLIAVVVLVHVVVELVGNSRSVLTLAEFGANHAGLVLGGEIHRLLTAMFLHVGLLHLGCNVAAIWILGRWVEPELGAARLLTVYFLSGVLGNLASIAAYHALDAVGAGASGGAMGLVGAATALSLAKPGDPTAARRLPALATFIGATLLIGFLVEGIDNAAHLGGLTVGFALGMLLTRRPRFGRRAYPAAACLFACLSVAAAVAVLVDLPGWRRTVRVDVGYAALDVPARSRVKVHDTVAVLEWVPIGELSIRPAPRAGLEAALSEAAEREGLAACGMHRIGTPYPGWSVRGRRAAADGEEEIELYALAKPSDDRGAILVFHHPPDDEIVRRRFVLDLLRTLRLR